MGMRRRFGGGMDELVKMSIRIAFVLELPRCWSDSGLDSYYFVHGT